MKRQPLFASFTDSQSRELLYSSMSETLLQLANTFCKTLPQSLGARWEGKKLILAYVVDEQLPADEVQYAVDNIDKYATAAYKTIFKGQDEIDLLLMDVRLVFSALFWDGEELKEVEFLYPMNELLFLSSVDNQ
jgi:hypothetical protein